MHETVLSEGLQWFEGDAEFLPCKLYLRSEIIGCPYYSEILTSPSFYNLGRKCSGTS
jgi:hypothetical protein